MRARPDRWLWGLVPALALGLGVERLSPRRFEAALTPKVEAALKAAPGADGASWAKVAVAGRDVALSGAAPSPETRRAALAALKATPGVRQVIEGAESTAASAPFAWSARREADRLVLSGAAPADAVRGDILRQAQALLPGLPVEDRASVAAGEPERFAEAASFALRLLGRLESGTVTIAGGQLSLDGTAGSTDAFEAVAASLREPPAGLGLARAVVVPPVIAPFTWGARRSGDAITVTGHAPSLEARERVAVAARRLNPSSRVSSDVRVARGLPPGLDYEAATDLLLAQLARMRDGEVGLADGVLRVSGATPDKDGAAQVAAGLNAEMPAGFRLGDLSLSPIRPQPYRFQARRAPGRLLLAGHLPDEAARDSLRSLVRRRFFVEVIDDQLRLADGAPAGFVAGASFGLEQLSRLAEGEASLKETALVVSGETLYEQTAEQMRAELGAAPPGATPRSAALPSGFTAEADIRVRRDPSKRERAAP